MREWGGLKTNAHFTHTNALTPLSLWCMAPTHLASRPALLAVSGLSAFSGRRALTKLQHRRPPPPTTRSPTAMEAAPPASRPGRSMDDHAATGAKLFAAAADRNKEPILSVLKAWLPGAGGRILEVASGTGQHAAFMAAALGPAWVCWQPTDADPTCLGSIAAHAADCETVSPPVALDVAAAGLGGWPQAPGGWDAVFAANLTHISPWAATAGLLAGAAATLRPGGRLILYGPFAVDGAPATPSDAAFDASLRSTNLAWGYRDWAGEVVPAAASAGLAWLTTLPMPANNFTLVFEKRE